CLAPRPSSHHSLAMACALRDNPWQKRQPGTSASYTSYRFATSEGFFMHLDGAGPERPAISIVIPAFNEAQRLPTSLTSIQAYVAAKSWPSEVLVVDDGSSDATAAIVEQWSTRWPALRL